jgi:hypothetical protein
MGEQPARVGGVLELVEAGAGHGWLVGVARESAFGAADDLGNFRVVVAAHDGDAGDPSADETVARKAPSPRRLLLKPGQIEPQASASVNTMARPVWWSCARACSTWSRTRAARSVSLPCSVEPISPAW